MWQRLASFGRRLFFPNDGAVNLAVLRVVVFGLLLLAPETRSAIRIAALPDGLKQPLLGWRWFPVVATGVGPVRVATVILLLLCASACVGFQARTSASGALLFGLYVFGVLEMGGYVYHLQHLLWLAALLSASPCGDALSLDARGRPPATDSPAYGFPLRVAWLLLGFAYLFPGLAKWRAQGPQWALGDTLRLQLWWKWAELDWMPVFRIDHHPHLLAALGLFVMCFEMTFIVVVFVPRLRRIAIAAALLFHLGTWLFMRIAFPSIFACFVAFVDWRPFVARADSSVRPAPARLRWPAIAMSAVLLSGSLVAGGAEAMRAFPFACYPTFAQRPLPALQTIDVEAELADGSRRIVPLPPTQGVEGQRTWGLIFRLLGDIARPGWLGEAQALWQALAPAAAAGGLTDLKQVRIYRVTRSLDPDQRSAEPLQRDLVAEFPP